MIDVYGDVYYNRSKEVATMAEKRTELGKMSKRDYIHEYTKETYDRVGLTLPKGSKDFLKEAAEARGLSVSALVLRAVEDFVERN